MLSPYYLNLCAQRLDRSIVQRAVEVSLRRCPDASVPVRRRVRVERLGNDLVDLLVMPQEMHERELTAREGQGFLRDLRVGAPHGLRKASKHTDRQTGTARVVECV